MVHLLEIKKKALENNVPIMKDDGISFITNYMKENNVHTVLEIGSAVGYSAICFSQVGEDVRVTTIERDVSRYEEALQNIHAMNLQDRITIYHADALTCDIPGQYDLIFIDAAKSQYIKFFEKYKVNLAPHGVIITDNLSFHGMVENPSLTQNRNTKQLVAKIRNYIEFLKNNDEFHTDFYELGDGISISRKK